MRPLLAAALLALAAVPVRGQPSRSAIASVVVDGGGSTELTRPRLAGQVGYAVEETGGSGLSIGARYVIGAHLLAVDDAAYREREGATVVSGGAGWLLDTGIDAEVGWRLGPLRPFGYTGYHFYRQRVDEAVCACPEGARTVPAERRQGFARTSGYGAELRLSGRGSVYAERFRGGGRGGVMPLDGIRAGLRIGT